ncbi:MULTISPECIES: hypothetical protein [Bacillus]|uniref:hypothetical protein n=1 Tax=Bacillus TaxID=1386 RepID=UPI00098B44A1|nr:hypothetical protein [Bacillus sonorensis]
MPHKMSSELKHHLMKANLYGLLAKRYEYVDPAKHMHFYQKHFKHVKRVEALYMGMHDNDMSHHDVNLNMPSHMNMPNHMNMNMPSHADPNSHINNWP